MPQRFTNLRGDGEGRAVHDVGGLPGGPIDRDEHDPSHYERRVDALVMLLTGHGAFRVDALRRMVETYAEQKYDGTPYYDRWIVAVRNLLVEQEVLTRPEIDDRIAAVRARLLADGLQVDPDPLPWPAAEGTA